MGAAALLVAALMCALAPSAGAAGASGPDGVTISVPTASTNDTSVAVSGDKGSDPSGIASWRIEQQWAPLSNDTCGTFGAWVQLGPPDPTDPVAASLVDATCYRYQFVSVNGDGFSAAATQVGVLKVDRTVPTATIDAPSVALHGTVTLTGSAADVTTRVETVSVSVDGRYSICPNASVANDGRWTCAWTIGASEVGPATLSVMATDTVGQRGSASVDVTIVKPPSPLGPRPGDVDLQAPVVGLARMPLVSWLNFVTVKASAFDDRPGTIEIGVEHQRIAAGAARFSPWRESYEETTRVELPRRGETNCWRGIAVDEAGNRAVSDARCTTLPLDDIDLAATGSWRTVRARAAYRGATRQSTRSGSALTVRVAGANPILVVTRCRTCGSIRVFHGRRVLGTYPLTARGTSYRQLIPLRRLVRPASAPIRIVTLSSRAVMIDGLVPGR